MPFTNNLASVITSAQWMCMPILRGPCWLPLLMLGVERVLQSMNLQSFFFLSTCHIDSFLSNDYAVK